MPTLCFQRTLLAGEIDRFLCLAYSSRRFEADSKVNGLSIRYTPLNAAGIVSLRSQSRLGIDSVLRNLETGVRRGDRNGGDESVIVFGARDFAATESGTDFETFGGWNTEHCMC